MIFSITIQTENRVSLFEYRRSIELSAHYSFTEIIMSAFRLADDTNIEKLKTAFPKIYEEAIERYNAKGGMLPRERFVLENPPVRHKPRTMIHKGKRLIKKNIVSFRKAIRNEQKTTF